MTAVQGIFQNGQVVFDAPADWPEGCRVKIEPMVSIEDDGGTGDEQRDDTESVAAWLAAVDAIPPFEMTPAEEAEWNAARQSQKDFEKNQFDKRAARIEGLFT